MAVRQATRTTANPPQPFPGKRSEWNSLNRVDFLYGEREATIVAPTRPAPGRPWIWRARFFGHGPQVDLALLRNGFHLAYVDVINLYGSPKAVTIWDGFYAILTKEFGFARKVALEGMSRGGLIVYNWAALHPDSVSCIYADAPVCDIRSWPGGLGTGTGSPEDWARCLNVHGLDEDTVRRFTGNPIDKLTPLAEAGVPLLHVCGQADMAVPVAENTRILARKYRGLGGHICVVLKPNCAHHPHCLENPTSIVDFILKHTPRMRQPS